MKVLKRAALLVNMQRELIRRKDAEIADLQRAALATQMATRDIALAWRVSMDSPEIDLRDDVDEMISALSDTICQLQEHI